MTRDQIENDVREFLADEAGLEADELGPEDKLFSSGILNSLDILALVSFIESKFGIKVDTWEISLEKFDTLTEISKYVSSKL